MDVERRYGRPVRKAETSEHLVAFLDILGFKQLLLNNELDRLFMLFEEFADAIYTHSRMAFLWGLSPIEPRMTNFSDSIILFTSTDDGEPEQVKQLKWGLFFDVCRAIIATSLKLRIPIRGAVSQGALFVGEAASVVPTSAHRWGNVLFKSVVDQFEKEAVRPDDYEDRILPSTRIPVHMGPALTDAYLMESSVNSIGCFISGSMNKRPVAEYLIATERVATHAVDGRDLLAVNWCNYWHYDTFSEIVAFAHTQVPQADARVSRKWRSLLAFADSAPTR